MMFLLACAPDIRDLDGDGVLDVALDDTETTTTDTGEDTGDGTTIDTSFEPHITVVDEGGGISLVEVDSNEGVTYVDLGVPEQTHILDGWEVSFERYFFRLNGGTNGDGGVEGVVITDQTFDAVTSAPSEGWETDTDSSGLFDDWYIYDSVEHVMYAAEFVYVLRNAEGEYWKLQILDYYDAYGNTGFPSFRVAALGTE